MKYINYVNQAVEGLKKQSPNNPAIIAIDQYKSSLRFPDYYQTLDDLSIRLGIRYHVHPVYDEYSDEVYTYYAQILMFAGNALSGTQEELNFEFRNTEKKAYTYVVKEYIYRLMNISNLSALVV